MLRLLTFIAVVAVVHSGDSLSYLYNKHLSAFISDDERFRPEEADQLFAAIDNYGDMVCGANSIFPSISDECASDMKHILCDSTPWAEQYRDSWAKPPSGIFSGNTMWYGEFDQCLSIPAANFSHEGNKSHTIEPLYCYTELSISRNWTNSSETLLQYFPNLMFGLCVSSRCSQEDLHGIVNPMVDMAGFHVVAGGSKCTSGTTSALSPAAIITTFFFSLVGFILTLGLAIDLFRRFMKRKATPADKIFTSFSPLKNLEKIFSVTPHLQKADSLPNLRAINGIRALSILWVILGHCYSIMMPFFDNAVYVRSTVTKRFVTQAIPAAVLSVDTFLVLSGFLAYLSLAKLFTSKREGEQEPLLTDRPIVKPVKSFFKMLPFVYLHRYLRLTPPYAAVIMIDVGLWAFLAQGPFYQHTEDAYCAENWWTNLLYVNNFVNTSRPCLGWSWYLAIDMQLSLLAPFIVYLFTRRELFAWMFSAVLVAIPVTCGALLTVIFHLPPYISPPPDYVNNLENISDAKNFHGYSEIYYDKFYTRMAPYIIGIVCCHVVLTRGKWLHQAIIKSKPLYCMFWLFDTALIALLVYGLWGWFAGNYDTSTLFDAMYNGLCRPVWAVAVGWIVVATCLDRASFIGALLSWPVFQVPARLSYCAYLIHPMVVAYYAQTLRRPFHYTDVAMIFFYCGTVVVVFLVSAIISVTFESPVLGVQRVLRRACKND